MFVVTMFSDLAPSRIYGPFDTEDTAFDWLDTRVWRLEFDAAVVHEVQKPGEDQCPPTPAPVDYLRGDERVLCAFALGYYHGRAVGTEENPYSGETQAHEHAAYTDGYERGVGDYTTFAHPEG